VAYHVKEIYYTLQGEGLHAGRPAVFCRFSGCNLWNGRAADRAKAVCTFCDTDFVGTDGPGGGKFPRAEELAQAIAHTWSEEVTDEKLPPQKIPCVVFTGGEPLLQLDAELIAAVKRKGFFIAVETNGTQPAPAGIDWLTVSPKTTAALTIKQGNELKLVYPQAVSPESVADLQFDFFFLSPLWSEQTELTEKHVQLAAEYCKSHPQWRLNLQRHKYWGIP
jgi:7-carboxy-7-deazaguanine synthase (Cx14CxxC type)